MHLGDSLQEKNLYTILKQIPSQHIPIFTYKRDLVNSEMETICYSNLKDKYTIYASSPAQSQFCPTAPEEIWEMEISSAREVAENNMYKLRISQGCTQEAQEVISGNTFSNGKMVAAAVMGDEEKSGLSKNKTNSPNRKRKFRAGIKEDLWW